MIDIQYHALQLALADSALVAGVPSITAGSMPPPEWAPSQGAALVLNIQGGPNELEQGVLWRPRLSLRAYGPSETAAWAAYFLAHQALHKKSNHYIIHCEISTSGQLLPPEPETGRILVLAFADLIVREL